ncbi:short-chain dehydrogenase [Flavobacterium noncentrifugens]|uniref:Short-chain dehydrogenase n=1 Tax=Flavobacterium noncentrifugens TaxID=1128970 RepID=A0A1G8RRW1_9FLAO|nr:SDR family oxidoreductase [Flavobacterium noncentrifugens]GEP49553.1 short-chain dehydrogenase [Flavobacterium noncentrifugens]SDJ19672.1 hypothetical protein SAMN04487935_0252 [Flavobacterium noncentrifugens]
MKNEYQKHALVTGATSGIGYELAKLLAKDNYSLVLVARNRENLEETARELQELSQNIHTHIIDIDLFEPGAAQRVYNKTQELGVRIDVLVNNAGQGEWGLFSNTDLEREIAIVQLNVVASMTLTKLYLKEMLERNSGKILQLASSVSKTPAPYLSVYAATKAFVLSLVEALQKEIENSDVTITALQPGATDTDFFHKAKAENTVTYKEASMYTPEEVAKAGFEGLMKGEATVVPGFMNKTQGILNSLMSDDAVADSMEKQMQPSKKTEGKSESKHEPSQRERQKINSTIGSVHGDYERVI